MEAQDLAVVARIGHDEDQDVKPGIAPLQGQATLEILKIGEPRLGLEANHSST